MLVRHSQTSWSVTGQHTGRTDLPLTEAGRALTRPLADRLAGRTFGHVVTSPLRRAVETAEIAGFGGAEVVDDLREWDYGDFEGLTTAEIHARQPGWDLWVDGGPGGDTPADAVERIDQVIDRLLAARPAGGDALVFSHGHTLRALAVRWLELPITEGNRFVLDTGSVSVLGWKRGVRALESWNDTSHLHDVP
ncbi:MAG: histidine phosphatase family protein [Actinomycetota bacterium]|nr:histidine phosphatase family protein [Actinomycetota bacterium]